MLRAVPPGLRDSRRGWRYRLLRIVLDAISRIGFRAYCNEPDVQAMSKLLLLQIFQREDIANRWEMTPVHVRRNENIIDLMGFPEDGSLFKLSEAWPKHR